MSPDGRRSLAPISRGEFWARAKVGTAALIRRGASATPGQGLCCSSVSLGAGRFVELQIATGAIWSRQSALATGPDGPNSRRHLAYQRFRKSLVILSLHYLGYPTSLPQA